MVSKIFLKYLVLLQILQNKIRNNWRKRWPREYQILLIIFIIKTKECRIQNKRYGLNELIFRYANRLLNFDPIFSLYFRPPIQSKHLWIMKPHPMIVERNSLQLECLLIFPQVGNYCLFWKSINIFWDFRDFIKNEAKKYKAIQWWDYNSKRYPLFMYVSSIMRMLLIKSYH